MYNVHIFKVEFDLNWRELEEVLLFSSICTLDPERYCQRNVFTTSQILIVGLNTHKWAREKYYYIIEFVKIQW